MKYEYRSVEALETVYYLLLKITKELTLDWEDHSLWNRWHSMKTAFISVSAEIAQLHHANVWDVLNRAVAATTNLHKLVSDIHREEGRITVSAVIDQMDLSTRYEVIVYILEG